MRFRDLVWIVRVVSVTVAITAPTLAQQHGSETVTGGLQTYTGEFRDHATYLIEIPPDWNGTLFYVENNNRFYGNDGEASVDGVHATDLGFMRMANVINPVIEKALDIR